MLDRVLETTQRQAVQLIERLFYVEKRSIFYIYIWIRAGRIEADSFDSERSPDGARGNPGGRANSSPIRL
ncbi:hypothetical protein Pse7367_3860 (plasmid) [Thalassoporum mexicanum PCC 7367]|nr:hypothetical protein Pse7367_3860 [Pseudanabaena sp. PCC 7367]